VFFLGFSFWIIFTIGTDIFALILERSVFFQRCFFLFLFRMLWYHCFRTNGYLCVCTYWTSIAVPPPLCLPKCMVDTYIPSGYIPKYRDAELHM